MPTDDHLAPDEAFAALGNETRVAILQALADADEPLGFSELRRRVGTMDSGQFNYHLDEVAGHFVAKTDDGYDLQRAGERVIEAVLSGAVTESPERDHRRVEQTCHFCGAQAAITYEQEQVTVYCTECAGLYGNVVGDDDHGLLGTLYLPPAGVQGRDASELLSAAYAWGGLATMAAMAEVCPRCSAKIGTSVDVCADHDAIDGVCEDCGQRYAAIGHFRCTNCIYDRSGAYGVRLFLHTDLLAFLTDHGQDPFRRPADAAIGELMDYEEEIRSVDPFEARFTFTADGDAITLTVDDDLAVTDVASGEDLATE